MHYVDDDKTIRTIYLRQINSGFSDLLNKHVSSDHGRRHVRVVVQELDDPVSDHGKQRHQVLDNLQHTLVHDTTRRRPDVQLL